MDQEIAGQSFEINESNLNLTKLLNSYLIPNLMLIGSHPLKPTNLCLDN